jgi:hypothetical protein
MGEWRFSSTIMTSTLDGGEWSASRPGRFSTDQTGPSIHCMGLCEPQTRSGHRGEEKITCPCWESNPGRPARSQSLYLTKPDCKED